MWSTKSQLKKVQLLVWTLESSKICSNSEIRLIIIFTEFSMQKMYKVYLVVKSVSALGPAPGARARLV